MPLLSFKKPLASIATHTEQACKSSPQLRDKLFAKATSILKGRNYEIVIIDPKSHKPIRQTLHRISALANAYS